MLKGMTAFNTGAPILVARHLRVGRPAESTALAGMGILSFVRSRPRCPLKCSLGAGRSDAYWRASFVGFTG